MNYIYARTNIHVVILKSFGKQYVLFFPSTTLDSGRNKAATTLSKGLSVDITHLLEMSSSVAAMVLIGVLLFVAGFFALMYSPLQDRYCFLLLIVGIPLTVVGLLSNTEEKNQDMAAASDTLASYGIELGGDEAQRILRSARESAGEAKELVHDVNGTPTSFKVVVERNNQLTVYRDAGAEYVEVEPSE